MLEVDRTHHGVNCRLDTRASYFISATHHSNKFDVLPNTKETQCKKAANKVAVDVEMWKILLIFRVFEAIFCALCLAAHIVGFLDQKEPLPHELLFCGTFLGFLMLSVLGVVSLIIDGYHKLVIEAGIALSGFACFMADSFVSMHHGEKDFHLMYKTVSLESSRKAR
jgi:hypothetical protein